MKTIFQKFLLTVSIPMSFGIILTSCGGETKQDDAAFVKRVDSFLVSYNNKYRELNIAANDGQWKLLTHMVTGDTATENFANRANDALAKFLGSSENIKQTQEFIAQKSKLNELQIEQLDHILYFAGGSPQTVADIVSQKIKAETDAAKKLYEFNFMLNGKSVTTNDIDRLLRTEIDTVERLKVWECRNI